MSRSHRSTAQAREATDSPPPSTAPGATTTGTAAPGAAAAADERDRKQGTPRFPVPTSVSSLLTAVADFSERATNRDRCIALAVLWCVDLGAMALMWYGLPSGGDGLFPCALLGLVLAVAGGVAGLALALPPLCADDPDRAEQGWALAWLFTTVVGAAGGFLVLGFDQFTRLWAGLGLA